MAHSAVLLALTSNDCDFGVGDGETWEYLLYLLFKVVEGLLVLA